MRHCILQLAGWLTINGSPVEVEQAHISYALNSIPRATFGLPVGRDVKSGRPAAIHRVIRELTAETKIEFWMQVAVTEGQSPVPLPRGQFKLFEGYYAGTSGQKSGDAFQVAISAKGWLLDMDYSSALSATSHPSNPSQFSYRASHIYGGAGSGSYSPFASVGSISIVSVVTDFWANCLEPWFKELTSLDRINTDELTFLGAGSAQKNDAAARALSRFSKNKGNYRPLAFDLRASDAGPIANSIWRAVQAETFESFANTTLWGKLVGEFAPTYMFAVVPRTSDALVVPFVPGLRTPFKTIDGEDYEFTSWTSEAERMLLGVGIFAGMSSRTGADNREPGMEGAVRMGVGGWYSPDNVNSGMVMLKQGPRWLTSMIRADRYAEFSCGSGAKAIGTSLHPKQPSSAGGKPRPAKPAEMIQNAKPIFDKYAEALYAYELLRLRQIEIAGLLRFDIAPGSTIILDTGNEPFIANDSMSVPLIGDVLQVTTSLNFRNNQAATSFNIGHVRMATENSRDGHSVEKNPIWESTWPGAPLLTES